MTYLPKSELVGVLAPYSINTRDVGVNWQTVIYNIGGVPSSSMYLGNGIAIVTGPNSVYRSTDYGKNWFVITSGLSLSVPIRTSVYIENGIAIIGAGLRIHRTTDFGVTWTDLGAFGAIFFFSSAYLGNGIVIIGVGNGSIRRSTDYGATWSAEIPVAAGIVISIVYLENKIVLLADSLGNIWRSTDFGVAWFNIADLGDFSTGNNLAYLGNGIVIAGTTGGNIWRSIDFGLTWQVLYAFGNIFHGIVYLGNGIVIAISEFNGGIAADTYRSDNFGLRWTDLGNISATHSLTTATYLSNGIAISVDNAGNINRSNVSYKLDESQVLLERPVTIVNADITVGQSHNTIIVDSPGANRIITLDDAQLPGMTGHEFIIKKIDATTSTVTITPFGGQTIDGAVSQVLNIQYQNIIIKTDGFNWYIVSPVTGTLSVLAAMGQLKPNVTRYSQPGWMIVRDSDAITMTGGFIYYVPFFVATTTTFTETVFNVTGPGGGGSTMDIRIFAWNDGVPGAQLVNVGTVATDSAGTKTIGASYTLDRGFYFIAMRNNLAVTVNSIDWSFPVSCPVGGTTSTTAASTNFTNLVGATVNSAFADPAPAPTAITINFPVFKLREN